MADEDTDPGFLIFHIDLFRIVFFLSEGSTNIGKEGRGPRDCCRGLSYGFRNILWALEGSANIDSRSVGLKG